MRLTDWITLAVERDMKQQLTKVSIPNNLNFTDLKLARDADGHVSFDWTPIEKICEESGYPIEILKEGTEDNVSALLVNWYIHHKQNGGSIDPVAEDLFSEVMAEEDAGQSVSYKPGRA